MVGPRNRNYAKYRRQEIGREWLYRCWKNSEANGHYPKPSKGMNPWSCVSASGWISGLPQNCQPQFRTAQFTECWNEQCSVIPNQWWQHVRICVLCPALQITKFFSSVTWWWVIPSDWKDWIGAMCTSDLPLPSPLSLLGGKVDQDFSPGEQGGKCSGEGCMCVCACRL